MRRAELKIEDVAFGGKGVARENGKAVFIPFTIDGERVAAEIVREKKKFALGEVEKVIEASPHRVAPECPYFGQCGGCSYQHIDYAHQLSLKWRQVRDTLQRIGKLKDIPLRPIIPSPLPYGYRNRVTVHVENGMMGFFRRDSHRLMDIKVCPISMKEVNEALTELRASRPRDGHYTLRADPKAPRVFSQANDQVALALRDLVTQFVPASAKHLIDAYSGSGFFAKAFRGRAARILGIDWDRFAIEIAAREVQPNESYIAGDVDVELRRALSEIQVPELPETIVIADPPATGLARTTRETLQEFRVGDIAYVSCNPPTLARDLAELSSVYAIKSVTPLDMFPQTAEVEVAVHLQSHSS